MNLTEDLKETIKYTPLMVERLRSEMTPKLDLTLQEKIKKQRPKSSPPLNLSFQDLADTESLNIFNLHVAAIQNQILPKETLNFTDYWIVNKQCKGIKNDNLSSLKQSSFYLSNCTKLLINNVETRYYLSKLFETRKLTLLIYPNEKTVKRTITSGKELKNIKYQSIKRLIEVEA